MEKKDEGIEIEGIEKIVNRLKELGLGKLPFQPTLVIMPLIDNGIKSMELLLKDYLLVLS